MCDLKNTRSIMCHKWIDKIHRRYDSHACAKRILHNLQKAKEKLTKYSSDFTNIFRRENTCSRNQKMDLFHSVKAELSLEKYWQ